MSWKERTEISKNILDVIKGLFILGIVAVLLFRYDWVNDLFDKYNVLQLEFGGLKMDRSEAIKRLKESADKLPQLQGQIMAAKQQVDDLQARYEEATKALTELKKERDEAVEQLNASGRTTPSSGVNFQNVLAQQVKTLALVNSTKSILENAASTTEQAVASLPTSPTAGIAKFALIFGSYRSLPPAHGAIEEAKRKNYQGVVFMRQGVFRTALQFPTEEAANAQLYQARSQLSSQAYVVNLANWCPAPVPESPGVLNCRL